MAESSKKVNRQLSIFINDKEVVNSLTGITRAVRTTTNQMNALNASSETYDADMERLRAQLSQLTTQQEAFREEIRQGNQALEASANSLEGVENRMKAVEKELRQLDASTEDYTQKVEDLRNEYRQLERQQEEYTENISLATRAQNINKNSLDGVEQAISQVKAEMRQLDRTTANYREELARLRAEEEELQDTQREMNREINGTEAELGEATAAFSMFFAGISSGNLTGAAAGFTGIKTAIIATTRAAWAFVTTPIGATITALAGIALAVKEWYNYNKEIAKATQLTAGITKLTGDALKDTRKRAQVIADTFDQDFEQLINVASTLVSEFGLSYEEAFDRIQDGLTKGGYANGEFLDSLREYPTFFAQAGFSAKEFQNILNTGADLSIYQDKLPDAIKEFGLAITEETDAAKDALTNAFGTEFTTKLLKGVKDGSVSVKEALFKISEEADRLGLNAQQAQLLTADLFKGAGEDAGGALKIFKAVNQSLENQKRPLSEIESAYTELTEKAKEVAEAEERAFGSDGFATWEKNFSLFFSAVKREYYDFLFVMTNGQEALDNLKADQRKADSEKRIYESNLKNYKGFLDGQKKALGEKYDFEAAKEIYMSTLRERYAKAGAGSWGDVSKEDKELQKMLEGQMKMVSKYQEVNTKTNNKNDLAAINARIAAKKAAADLLKKQQEEDKKAAEQRSKDYIKAQQELAKANLEYYISTHQTVIKEGEKLTPELIRLETERLQAINQERLKALQMEKSTSEAIIGIKKWEGVELNAADIEYLTAKQNLEVETLKTTDALKKQYKEEQKQLELEQAQYEYEVSLANAQTADEEEALRRDKKYKDDKAAYKKLFDDKKITAKQYADFLDRLDKDQKASERQRELGRTAENLQALNSLAGSVGELFGQSKELALAQAGINGALAITSILAQYPKFDGGFAMYAAMAAAVLSTAASVKDIKKQKAPKRAKFFDGGFTGNDIKYPDQYGGVAQINEFHANEWVAPAYMLRQPRYANVVGWLEAERQSKGSGGELPGTAAGGSAGTPTPAASATGIDPELKTLMALMINRLENPVAPALQIGYEHIRDINKMNNEIATSVANGKANTE